MSQPVEPPHPGRALLRDVAHRPWPLPRRAWVMRQSWHDLLFAHWPVRPAALRERVPAELPLDLHDGTAWIGVVPFRMTGVAPRGLPAPGTLSAFPELNVRTYVTLGGRPGVHFFSLDATSRLAVAAARVLFGLPYHAAEMACVRDGEDVSYRCLRVARAHGGAEFLARYGPTGAASAPAPGTLEHFLTERYCLYTARGGRVKRLEIHHPPWALQPAAAEIARNTMARAAGLALPDTPPLLHFARRQDMLGWWPVRA
jgi:uncharacterized protein